MKKTFKIHIVWFALLAILVWCNPIALLILLAIAVGILAVIAMSNTEEECECCCYLHCKHEPWRGGKVGSGVEIPKGRQ